MSKIRFVGGSHHSLQAEPFLCFDTASASQSHSSKTTISNLYKQSEGNTGHVGVLAHRQPILEKYLRTVVDKAAECELRSSCELTSISEDKDWVYATYKDVSGMGHKIRAKFLAAADGKTGYTRKMYLEPRGIELNWAEQYVVELMATQRTKYAD